MNNVCMQIFRELTTYQRTPIQTHVTSLISVRLSHDDCGWLIENDGITRMLLNSVPVEFPKAIPWVVQNVRNDKFRHLTRCKQGIA